MIDQKDVFGNAIADYYLNSNTENIIVKSPDFQEDEIPISYLFRDFSSMPKIEQIALKTCKGKVLDVGCGAGSHSLYLQQNNRDVMAIDTSPKAISTCLKRGVQKASVIDFFNLKNQQFDTILLLMNGIGIVGKLEKLHLFFDQVKSLLNPNAQVLLDSSDLIYLYEGQEEEIKKSPFYYGEMEYEIRYQNYESEPFHWLYIDYNSLAFFAELHGFTIEKLLDGPHFDYLARLTLQK